MQVASSFDVVRWLRPGGDDEQPVDVYHRTRRISKQRLDSGVRMGDFLLNEEASDVVAFGMDEHTAYMASPFILSVDPAASPWTALQIAAGEMRRVARNERLGWHHFSWWKHGERLREVDLGLMEGDPVQEGAALEFEAPFWAWVAQAEPVPDVNGLSPDPSEAWLEVPDVLIAMALQHLMELDPEDVSSWDWTVDTYRVPPL